MKKKDKIDKNCLSLSVQHVAIVYRTSLSLVLTPQHANLCVHAVLVDEIIFTEC